MKSLLTGIRKGQLKHEREREAFAKPQEMLREIYQ